MVAIPVKLSTGLVNEAKRYASIYSRSLPKQIEYWSKIGKIAEENPDLPYSMIMMILVGQEEAKHGLSDEYQFGDIDD